MRLVPRIPCLRHRPGFPWNQPHLDRRRRLVFGRRSVSSSSSSSTSSPRRRAACDLPRSPSAERVNGPDFAAGFLQKRRRLMPGSGGIGGGNSGLDGGGGGGCGLPPRIASPLARLTPARHEVLGEEAPAPPAASPRRRRAGSPSWPRSPAPPQRQQQQPSGVPLSAVPPSLSTPPLAITHAHVRPPPIDTVSSFDSLDLGGGGSGGSGVGGAAAAAAAAAATAIRWGGGVVTAVASRDGKQLAPAQLCAAALPTPLPCGAGAGWGQRHLQRCSGAAAAAALAPRAPRPHWQSPRPTPTAAAAAAAAAAVAVVAGWPAITAAGGSCARRARSSHR